MEERLEKEKRVGGGGGDRKEWREEVERRNRRKMSTSLHGNWNKKMKGSAAGR